MAARPVEGRADRSSLFRGVPAVAYVLTAAGDPAYEPVLRTLDAHLDRIVGRRLAAAHDRLDGHRPAALREYDLVGGLTGLGTLLGCRRGDSPLLRDVLAYLVRLTEPTGARGSLPGWWSGHSPDDRPSPRWPDGHGNLGLAHGIAGPLALLATTMRHGTAVAGQADAIDRIAATLGRFAVVGPRSWWPGTITRAEWEADATCQDGPQRPSWCYGTPGIARALQLAAIAVENTTRRRCAEATLADCASDDAQLARLDDATLCHGWAGLLHTVWRTATDPETDDDRLAAAVPHIAAGLDRHVQRYGPPSGDGLLDGKAGLALAGPAITDPDPTGVPWDACLLLTG